MAFQAGRREPASQCSHSNCHSGLSAVGDGPQGQPGACSSCHSCSWLDDCSQGLPGCQWQSCDLVISSSLLTSRLVPFDQIKKIKHRQRWRHGQTTVSFLRLQRVPPCAVVNFAKILKKNPWHPDRAISKTSIFCIANG